MKNFGNYEIDSKLNSPQWDKQTPSRWWVEHYRSEMSMILMVTCGSWNIKKSYSLERRKISSYFRLENLDFINSTTALLRWSKEISIRNVIELIVELELSRNPMRNLFSLILRQFFVVCVEGPNYRSETSLFCPDEKPCVQKKYIFIFLGL